MQVVVGNHHYLPCNNPEECISQLFCGRNLNLHVDTSAVKLHL